MSAARFSLMSIVGARPQFVKAAAVSRALSAAPEIDEALVHTGQHFDANMSDVFFDELQIPPPRRHFNISGGNHGDMTGRMLIALEAAMLEDKPTGVLIYGDTNSTLAGALAAAKLHIPVIHVEAGLRSYNKRMPEEVNRVLTDHISDLLLCPTAESVRNLAKEGITKNVLQVGDVMHDATLFAAERARTQSHILETLGLKAGDFALCTLHRAENTDDPQRLARLFGYLADAEPQHPIVFPVHPRTRKAIAGLTFSAARLKLIDPVGYFDMQALLAACRNVYTDSGGLQKEAYFHRKLCVTLREETEWVETVEAGWNRLWTQPNYATPRRDITDYGAGDAAQRTAREVLAFFKARA